MAFKSKKWVKPGTVLPDSNRPPLAPAGVPVVDNSTKDFLKSIEPATRSAPPSRKWVKPGSVQASASYPVLANASVVQPTTSDITSNIVQHDNTAAPRAEHPAGTDPASVNSDDGSHSASHAAFPQPPAAHPPDPEACAAATALDAEPAAGAPAAEPPPPPPSYWKVVRAEAEAKAAVEEAAAAVPGAGTAYPPAALAREPAPRQQ
jgi:hypothetical protein